MRGGRPTAELMKNQQNLKSMLQTDLAVKFLKNMRGAPAYWLYDLVAMVRQLGTPTWFLTLSSADMQWQEVIQSIGTQYGKNFTNTRVCWAHVMG